ncbi:MAG: hypothetical protein WD271_00715 [Acidimicrobiia bacterium]
MGTVGKRSGSLAAAAALLGALLVPMLTTSAGAATGTTGPQVAGVGIGSKAALAEDTCTAATKRTSFAAVGSGPLCVNPWPAGKDNGGATAPGVTADSVKVVVYYGNEAMEDAERAAGGRLPINQVTGQPGTWTDSFKDFDEVFQYAIEKFSTYQTWGRKPVYEFVKASGPDEAAQRADALLVKGLKPFIVIDAANQSQGASVFEAEMANAKIIVNGAAASALTTAQLEKQAPYRWATQADSTASIYLVANFLSNSLSGRKARWAGDSALASKKRAFGLVSPEGRIDVPLFNSLMKKYGGTATVEAVAYDPEADSATIDETAKTLIAKLKSKGVTSVILFANNTTARSFTAAATSNDFNPEWIVTGYQFQDFDGFARTYDQAQMEHAFGLGVLTPRPTADPTTPAPLGQFEWYWGKTQGTTAATTIGWMSFIYGTMQYAGPMLTAQNVKKGLFSVPAVGGASNGTVSFQTGYGRTVGLPYDEYLGLGTDVNLIWWNADLKTGGTNAVETFPGTGRFMYLNGGKRFSFGQFPKSEPKFFDEAASLYEFPPERAYSTGKVPAANPCTGCPSQGGAGA